MKSVLMKILSLSVVSMLITGAFISSAPVYAEAENQGEPILLNGGFESDLNRNDIQVYKAQRVDKTQGKVRSGNYSIKVGSEKPIHEEDYASWLFNGGKGSVGLTIRNIEPNTEYTIQGYVYNETGVKMRIGVLDIEGYASNYQPGKLSSQKKSINNKSSDWVEASFTITSGPRSTELYVFALTEWTGDASGVGVFYVDDISVIKGSKKAEIVDTTIDYDYDYVKNLYQEFPDTIPMIQSFKHSDNQTLFNVDKKGQLIYSDEESKQKAQYFADKLVEDGIVEAYQLEIISKENLPQEGIVIIKSPITFEYPEAYQATKKDAYEITVSERSVVLNGEGISGVQNGAMTLLQAFKQRDSLPAGKVEDYTLQQIRGLQVDTGRRYYSIDWLKSQIEQMAYQKLNKLQVRLKDNEGIRYDSKVAPQFVDRAGGYWTDAEVKELVAFARKFEIEVIPEVDLPGHSEQDGVYFPKSWLLNPDNNDSRALNFTLPEVQAYMAAIYKEAFDLFESDIVHMGADEYFQTRNLGSTEKLATWAKSVTGDNRATAKDAYKLFFNELGKPYLDAGKTVLLWNDNIDDLTGPAVKLDQRFTIDYWASTFYSSISVDDALNNGHQIMGSAANLYHDLWPETDKLDRPLPLFLFNTWTQYTYSTGWGYKTIQPTPQSLGQMFPIWDDAHGYVPEYILTRTLFTRLGLFSNLIWGADQDDAGANKRSYADTERLIYQLGAVNDQGFKQVRMDYTPQDVQSIVSTLTQYLDLLDESSLNKEQQMNVDKLRRNLGETGNQSVQEKTYAAIFGLIHQYENLLAQSPKYGVVTVSYVDEMGKPVADNTRIHREDVNLPRYEVSAMQIDGFELIGVQEGSASESGIFTKDDKTITYIYKERKSPVDPTDPVNPVDPVDPVNPENPKNPGGTSDNGSLPLSGLYITTSLVGIGLIVVGAGVYVLSVVKQRRKEDE